MRRNENRREGGKEEGEGRRDGGKRIGCLFSVCFVCRGMRGFRYLLVFYSWVV